MPHISVLWIESMLNIFDTYLGFSFFFFSCARSKDVLQNSFKDLSEKLVILSDSYHSLN